MSNRRPFADVLNDMADECQKELDAIIATDEAERGYSEGAREELTWRVRACRAGAGFLAAYSTPEELEP